MLLFQVTEDPAAEGGLDGNVVQRSIVIYLLSCFLGALLNWVVPFVGTLFFAYGASVLWLRGKGVSVLLPVVVAAGVAFLVSGEAALITVVIECAVLLLLVSMLTKGFNQGRCFLSVAALSVTFFLRDFAYAWLSGTTIWGSLAAETNAMVKAITALGTVPAETITVLKEAVDTIVMFWPSFYVVEGALCMVALGLMVLVARRRHSLEAHTFELGRLDLSVHVGWVLLAGLVCVAVSFMNIAFAQEIKLAGYNLLFCAALIYMVQGFAVTAYYMGRAGWSPLLRGLVYLVLLQMELMFLAPSFVGLADYWCNFRKLPREDGEQDGEKEQGTGSKDPEQ